MNLKEITQKYSATKILGLGESSHGTHEFFEFKSRLFQALVIKHSFNTLLFEDSPLVCESINSFIASGDGNLDELMKQLYSVWRVEELKQLIEWLRSNYTNQKVEFVGFDIKQTEKNLHKRDELMAKNIKKYTDDNPDSKAMVWAHNSHIQVTGSNFNKDPMGKFLRKFYGDDYVAIGLLFGKGKFSATKLKMDAKPNSNRTLSVIAVRSIPSEITEYTLRDLYSEPYFMSKSELSKLDGNLSAVRSMGWGLVPELANQIVEQTNIKNAFDGVVYFPKSTASQPLEQ